MRFLRLMIVLWMIGLASAAYAQAETTVPPENLAVPEGNTLFLSLIGDGVQIYQCQESTEAAGTYAWVFVAPQAHLYNVAHELIGIHYAGPSWEAHDGSIVIGEVVEPADSPDGAIPWLLLRVASVEGNGLFSHVTYIQRVDTYEGIAPAADSCTEQDADRFVRVPYRTLYWFYAADPVDMTPTDVPDNLQVPDDSAFAFQLLGDGVQVYRCEESAETTGAFAWVLAEPQADLLNEANERVGIHYRGPTWESPDGSFIVGEVVERADSPNSAIPWLLLRAASTVGNGQFGNVTYIQRLDTVGGNAPDAETCTTEQSEQIVRVPYSALYVFYSAE